jgi:hypothetical protein
MRAAEADMRPQGAPRSLKTNGMRPSKSGLKPMLYASTRSPVAGSGGDALAFADWPAIGIENGFGGFLHFASTFLSP